MIGVYVEGQNVAALGYVGGLGWSHQWPGGCWDAGWDMAGLSRTAASRFLRRGAEARIYLGTWPVWRGELDEMGDAQGSFTARGYYRAAERFLALTSADTPTSDITQATTQAIADGWRVEQIPGVPPPTGVPADEPQLLHQAIDTAATAAGVRWGVDAFGRVYYAADPTTPSLILTPGQPLMGRADDSYVTTIYAEYYSALAGTPPVPSDPLRVKTEDAQAVLDTGRSVAFVDLKPRGVLSATDAQNIIDGMLAKGRARVGFTSSLTVGWHQLLTLGGTPANPATVTAGQMVRVYGAVNPDGSSVAGGSVDFVIGATAHEAGSRSITLTPVGLEPRTLSDILAVIPVEQVVS